MRRAASLVVVLVVHARGHRVYWPRRRHLARLYEASARRAFASAENGADPAVLTTSAQTSG